MQSLSGSEILYDLICPYASVSVCVYVCLRVRLLYVIDLYILLINSNLQGQVETNIAQRPLSEF